MMKIRLYLMEAFGLSLFMISACYFSSQLEAPHSYWHHAIPNPTIRIVLIGFAMGLTALFIFYSPFTAPSGSHINPAVTLAFLRANRIDKKDAFFYIVFQILGGLLGVYLMAWLLKDSLTKAPVNYIVTKPNQTEWSAIITEFITGFIMMTMVLNISSSPKYGVYTRIIAASLVTLFVIVAGPISGFGMNPARSLASAIPAGIYTSFWIYIFIPIISMLGATELFLYQTKKRTQMKKTFKYHWIIILGFLLSPSLKSFSQVKKVEMVVMTVKNMDRSIQFYTKVLHFVKVSDVRDDSIQKRAWTRKVKMQLGEEAIQLTEFHPFRGRPIPKDMKSNDLYFQHIAIVVSDMDKAYSILKENMTEHISAKPETIPKSNVNAAGIKAFYFYDLDHHDLELIYFPKGKGQPRWQDSTDKIFLGIDHTAIAIKNTKESLHFYRDILGIEPKGESWNQGMEQMELSRVKGASLHITGLKAIGGGTGIEFLEYLNPGPGKPYPLNTQMRDIWYWQIDLLGENLNKLYQKLDSAQAHFLIKLTKSSEGNFKYFVVKDPDGHALKIRD